MLDVETAISTVGFPIVAFLLMFYQSTKTIKENTKILSRLCILVEGSNGKKRN